LHEGFLREGKGGRGRREKEERGEGKGERGRREKEEKGRGRREICADETH
jgi:hypothetical protein